jgi:hypothetical protein
MRSIAIPILIAAASAFALQGPILYSIQVTQDTTITLGWRNNDAAARIFRVIRKDAPDAPFAQRAYLWYADAYKDTGLDYGHTYRYAVIGDDGAGNTDTSNVDSITTPPRPRICNAPYLLLSQDVRGRTVLQVFDRCNSERGYEIRRGLGDDPVSAWDTVSGSDPVSMGILMAVDSTLPPDSWSRYQVAMLRPDDSLRSDVHEWFSYQHAYGVPEFTALKLRSSTGSLPMSGTLWTLLSGDTLYAGESKSPDSAVSLIDVSDPAAPRFIGYRNLSGYPGNSKGAYYSDSNGLFAMDVAVQGDTEYTFISRYALRDGAFILNYRSMINAVDKNFVAGGTGKKVFYGLMDDSTLLCSKSDKESFRGVGESFSHLFAVRLRDGKQVGAFGVTSNYHPIGLSGGNAIGFLREANNFDTQVPGIYLVGNTPSDYLVVLGAQGNASRKFMAADTLFPPASAAELREGQVSWNDPVTAGQIHYGYFPHPPSWRWIEGYLTSNTDLLLATSVNLDPIRHLAFAAYGDHLTVFTYEPVSVGMRAHAQRKPGPILRCRPQGPRSLQVIPPEGWTDALIDVLDLRGRRIPLSREREGSTYRLTLNQGGAAVYLVRAASHGGIITWKWAVAE